MCWKINEEDSFSVLHIAEYTIESAYRIVLDNVRNKFSAKNVAGYYKSHLTPKSPKGDFLKLLIFNRLPLGS
jgi:hypothetical protein